MQFTGFHKELGNANIGEIALSLCGIHLHARSRGAVFRGPFAQSLPQVVAVPEATVEDAAQSLVPLGNFFVAECAVEAGVDGFIVAAHGSAHIFRSAGTTFNLQYAHSGINHLVHEVNGLEVFGRHDILVLNIQLIARLAVAHGVAAATNLAARTAVG